jgi:hypothetical protein
MLKINAHSIEITKSGSWMKVSVDGVFKASILKRALRKALTKLIG